MKPDERISIVVPVYDEELTVGEFYRRTKAVLTSLAPQVDHEIIFVNDGSRDDTLSRLRQLRAADSSVKVISLSRNFGHQIAITAGIDSAVGTCVVIIDGDLQDPPEVIAGMYGKYLEGFDVIYGVRKTRKGETAFKVVTAKLFYRLLSRLSSTSIPVDTGDFRLMSKKVVDALKAFREEDRYFRGMVAWVGFRQTGLQYERDPRIAGKTKYPLRKMLRFAISGIASFSDKPLGLSSRLGTAVTVIAVIYGLWNLALRILEPEHYVAGWTSLMLAVLFLGGIQLITLGILGQYIARIFREVKRRPLYLIDEKIGFESDRKSVA